MSGLNVEKESDYEANKILSDNIGFQMLKRSGWSEGGVLGDVGKLKLRVSNVFNFCFCN